MKYTIITALIMLTACAKDPQRLRTQQRDIVADIIARDAYDRQQTQISIVDRNEALRQLDMPIYHFEGC